MFSYSILFLIMTVSFLSVKEFKVRKNENFYQRIYYYVGGYIGCVFLCYIIWENYNMGIGYVMPGWILMLIFLSLISCRIEYVYKEKYLKALNNSDRSKISADEKSWKLSFIIKWSGIIAVFGLSLIWIL